MYEVSIFNYHNYYPFPWYTVKLPDDLPTLANNALVLRLDINDPLQFSQSLILAISRQQREQVRTWPWHWLLDVSGWSCCWCSIPVACSGQPTT